MNTNAVTQNENNTVTSNYASTGKTVKAEYGRTIGSPELSDSAAKYYEQLKKKYSNMDFVLVSEDKKAEAQNNAGRYANENRTVVLIDTDKIEKMASDENYRKKYEGIISGATAQLEQMKSSLGSDESSVKTFGIQVSDNGTASFFAVIDKSQEAQKKRIEKNAAKNAEENKMAAEKASEVLSEKKTAHNKTAHNEAADKKTADNKTADKESKVDKTQGNYSTDMVTVTASSIEELITKIHDNMYEDMSNHVETDSEKKLGQNIDFSA